MMDPKTLLTSKEVLDRIESICRRRLYDEQDAEECYLFVLDSLKASEYKRLRGFKGKSNIKTYVYTVINSLVSDFRRKKYGRKRIPKVVSRLGEWAETVYRLVCWEKYTFREAYDISIIEGVFKGSLQEFMENTDPIRHAPCRENPRFVSADADEKEPMAGFANPDPNPLDALLDKLDHEQKEKAVSAIQSLMGQLSEEDQFLVRLVYASDHSVAAASRVIGISKSVAGRRLKGLLTKFREQLLKQGIREI